MSWYKFKKGESVGTSIIEDIHTCFYCKDLDWACFDEHHSSKDTPFKDIIAFVENGYKDRNTCDKSRVFLHCSNGKSYELKVEELKDKNQGCYYKDDKKKINIFTDLKTALQQAINIARVKKQGYDYYIEDSLGGVHTDGVGYAPDGTFCGECTRQSCASCPTWLSQGPGYSFNNDVGDI